MGRCIYESFYVGLNIAEFCLFKSDVVLGYPLKVLHLAMLGHVQACFGWLYPDPATTVNVAELPCIKFIALW